MTGDETSGDGEWIAAAEGVISRSSGRRALDELEWDALGDLRDEDARLALASLFRAQGRVLGATPALGVLVANRLLGAASADNALTTVTRVRVAGDSLDATALAGFDEASSVVVELVAGDGQPELWIADRSAWSTRAVGPGALDPEVARSVRVDRAALQPVDGPPPPTRAGDRSRSLARLAIAHEILGVCDRLVALAASYAREREQFGAPIGTFQAVAHLLAEAEVRRRTLRDACRTSLARSGADGPDERETTLLKGLAGQTGRGVAQHSLQVLGGIGFTWEHEHHRYARRSLTLDALYGTVEEMRIRAARDLDGASVLRTPVG